MKKITISLMLLLALIMIPGIIFASEEVSTETELRQALEKGESVILKNDIVILEKTKSILTTQDRDVGIVINGEGNITIDGNGKTISSSAVKSLFEIYATGSSKINVTFENVMLEASKAGGRCIDTRTTNIVLNINNSNLTTYRGSYDQTLTIGGDPYTTPIEVNLNNSNIISKSHYAIITFNPVKLKINDCKAVAGFAAVYMRAGSANSNVIVNNSELSGTNSWSAESGSFGTITLEDKEITINAKNSTIIAKEEDTGKQYVFDDRKGENTFIAYNSKIEAEQDSMKYVDGTEIILGDKTILVDPSITNEEMLKDFTVSDTVCKKTGTNEYTIFKQYSIAVEEVEGGNVAIDKTKAIYGETIILSAITQEGFEFKAIEISDGKKIEKLSEGEYILNFESDVTVTPIFEKLKQSVEAPKEVVIDEKTENMLISSLDEVLKENKELAILVNNNNVEVEVVLEDSKVEDKEKETIEKAIEEKVKDIKVAKYIDISINVKVILDEIPDGKVVEQLEELKEKLTFSVEIPTDLPTVEDGYTRTYYIIRNHNGAVEILDTKVSEDGKALNFSSDKFSTYAIAYADKKIEDKVEDKIENKVEEKVGDKIENKVEEKIGDKKEEKDETPKTGTLNITMYILIVVVIILFVKVLINNKNEKCKMQ